MIEHKTLHCVTTFTFVTTISGWLDSTVNKLNRFISLAIRKLIRIFNYIRYDTIANTKMLEKHTAGNLMKGFFNVSNESK